jgi:enoyl-CoA hydratase/carnithine racemase
VSGQRPEVRLERHGDVTELIWAAPRLNLFTGAVADEFDAALGSVPAGTRTLLLRAEGKVFCRRSRSWTA